MEQEKRKISKTTKQMFYGTLGVIFLILVWTIFSIVKVNQGYNANLFPNPLIVLKRFFINLADKTVWYAVGMTFLRLLVGFGISFVAAGIVGILGGLFERVRFFVAPIISVMKSIPTAAITFVFLLMLGRDWVPCALVFLVCFPIVYESFVKGITSIDKTILNAVKLESEISRPEVIFKVVIPSSYPYVSLSIITSLGLSMKVSVMAEIVAGGSSANGLGRLIYIANQIDVDIPNVYALSLLAILIIGICNLVLFLMKKYFIARKEQSNLK